MREIRQNTTQEAGGVMLEAAISFPVFFLILFFFIEVCLAAYDWAIVQFSMDTISRDTVVQSAASVPQIEQAIIRRVERLGLGVTLRPEDILVCDPFEVPCIDGVSESRGPAGSLFSVQIRHQLDFSLSPWSAQVRNTLFVRNEPR